MMMITIRTVSNYTVFNIVQSFPFDQLTVCSSFLLRSNINFLQKNIIANLSEHRDPININEENYEDVWPLHYQRLSEQNMTHHLKNCSVEDELNQVSVCWVTGVWVTSDWDN